ncbi:hypothetical protein HmCmsJML025_04337 [Escherichia coli]|nr:hypothetical protein HmCmsJML025_04337 [Escherichia coli]
MLCEIAKTNRLPAIAKAKENHAQANDNHHDNRGDFDHREPELDFAVQPHRSQIRQRHQRHRDQCGYPLRHLREPELDINANGGDF